MQRFSILDLSPVAEGGTVTDSLRHTVELAQLAEETGYHRFWLAEHHSMKGIASAATAVLIGQVAAHTKTIRVGSGGVMLPNHAPLVIAEQFGTLESLFPGRIDLGLGRAPGTDGLTMRALRRSMDNSDNFPQDVMELQRYLAEEEEGARVRAVPGQGTNVPIWILGSSLYGAQLAAHLGLPYAFASHFAPMMLEQAIEAYRLGFRPSEYLDKPYFMLAAGICVADTDEEAQYLRSSQQQAFARLRSGNPGKLPLPVKDIASEISPSVLAQVNAALSCSAVGSPDTVRQQMQTLIDRYQPEEVMVTGAVHDHAARLKSFRMAADIMSDMVTSTD